MSSPDHVVSIPVLVKIYERLNQLPDPVLDLSTETQTLTSLLDVGRELRNLAPHLTPLVCQMLLRELGRFAPDDRESWIRAILRLGAPEDESLMRGILERIPAVTVIEWIVTEPDEDGEQTFKRIQSLFRAVSRHDVAALVDSLGRMPSERRPAIERALPILRSKFVSLARPLCARASPDEAAELIRRLRSLGGKQIVPLITQLVRRLNTDDEGSVALALTTLAGTGDRAFASTLGPYLDHTSRPIRLLTVRLLVRLGGETAVDLVAQQLRKKELDVEEKKEVLTLLSTMASHAAWRIVKKYARPAFFGNERKELRQHAAALLGESNAGHQDTQSS